MRKTLCIIKKKSNLFGGNYGNTINQSIVEEYGYNSTASGKSNSFGTVLWLQDNGIVCAKGTDLLRFDTDGKITRQTPAKDFIDEEAIAWIKEDFPDAFEKIVSMNLWNEKEEC